MSPIPRLVLAFAMLAAPAPAASAAGGTVLDRRTDGGALPEGLAYTVYLPDGHAEGLERYPVLYLLHGYGADRFQWLDSGRIAEARDGLIAAGRLPPVIAVMPEGGNSWYVDSAAFGGPGDYETAIVRDLVAEVDRSFRTEAKPGARAIAGLSMGGFGALRLAFRHPEVFGAVAAMSPAIWKPGALSWSHGPASMPHEAAAAKFHRTTGPSFDARVMEAQVPFAEVPTLLEAPEPPRIMLTVGDDDWFAHYDGTVEMFLDLRSAGLKPELRVADGGHDWNHWRPMATEVLEFLAEVWRPGS